MPHDEPTWKRYLSDHNEGLGLVYERFVLNDFLSELAGRHGIKTVLEAPVYGMAGVSGINSVILAQRGCQVTLADDHFERLQGIQHLWTTMQLPARHVLVDHWGHLPFPSDAFDLTWNWAALWHIADPAGLLQELVRTSRHLIFVAMPNRMQIGYLLRKYLLEPEFVHTVDESWTDMRRVRMTMEQAGAHLVSQGVLDVPPWPDTVMPASEVLRRLGLRSQRLERRFSGAAWEWSTMDYYLGRRPELRQRVMRYAFLDRSRLPWQIKTIWAHHRYVLFAKAPSRREM